MVQDRAYTRDDLIELKPEHATFVGIDSDGCVFDTMEIKQKGCFHGHIVSQWGLEAIEPQVRQAAEFVNLYSCWRGTNRFIALLKLFDLLRGWEEIRQSGVALPTLASLRQLADAGIPLGNPALQDAVKQTNDLELAGILQWSINVNATIARTVTDIPPYRWALKSLERIAASSDAICVSQTPNEALVREWDQHGITHFVRAIAGQELGKKSEHIALATEGRYSPDKILMIGDAPGDCQAARDNHAHFYPINPGQEEVSWQRFHEEAYDRFLVGEYGGEYEKKVTAEFEALLPETPPWEK